MPIRRDADIIVLMIAVASAVVHALATNLPHGAATAVERSSDKETSHERKDHRPHRCQ